MAEITTSPQAKEASNAPEESATIIVLGLTGSGKSSFVNLASGSKLAVGSSLSSCTADIAVTDPFVLSGKSVTLIDTPGFDDSEKSELKIIRLLAEFLKATYEKGRVLNGVIFLQRISDPRVGGAAVKSIERFKKICGADVYKNVRIVTTMWDGVDKEIGEDHQKELETDPDFFGKLTEKGAVMISHDGTIGSAQKIVADLLRTEAKPLELQREMVDQKKKLYQTKLGIRMSEELTKQHQRHQKEIEDLKKEINDLILSKNDERKEELKELQEELSDLKAQLEATSKEERELADRDSKVTQECREKMERLVDDMEAKERDAQNFKIQLRAHAEAIRILKSDSETMTLKAEKDRTAAENAHRAELQGIAERFEEERWRAGKRYTEEIASQLGLVRTEMEGEQEDIGRGLQERQGIARSMVELRDAIQGVEKRAANQLREAEEAHRATMEAALRSAEERMTLVTGQYKMQLDLLARAQEEEKRQMLAIIEGLLRKHKGEIKALHDMYAHRSESEWEDMDEDGRGRRSRGRSRQPNASKKARTGGRQVRYQGTNEYQGPSQGLFRRLGMVLDMMISEGDI